jgi:hypothetical protein
MRAAVQTDAAPLPTPILFSEEYYRETVKAHGYDSFDLERFDFGFAGLEPAELNLRYLCHYRAHEYLSVPPGSRVVTTGFGMSGPPHMGTVSQIIKTIQLQRAGERCQIVLGDLDAHNGKGRPLAQTRELASRFTAFCQRLGFDGDHGVLRSQFDESAPLLNMYLLSHHVVDTDFVDAEACSPTRSR